MELLQILEIQGGAASCNVNVACPAGATWDKEKKSVAIISANGATCTGTLIMNTCGTNIPYLLTAKHCVDAEPNVQNWVFQFFYYSTQCNSNTGYREDIQFFGSTLKASSSISDFALLQLSQTPAINSGLYYAGWSREAYYNSNVTLLHHPAGDVMKISQDYESFKV